MIKCELVLHKALIPLKSDFFSFKERKICKHLYLFLTYRLSCILKKQLSQICNHDIKFYCYICYFRKFDITRECSLVEMLHQNNQFVSL